MSVASKVKKATEAVTNIFTPEEFETKAVDILDTLEREHDEMRSLLSDLQDADGAPARVALVQRIRQALVPHMKAEEKIVYDAVKVVDDAHAQTDAHEGHLEHEWTLRTLERLDALADATSPEHRATAKVLQDLVEHHIQEEESNIWSDVATHFSEDERARMNIEYRAAKKAVRIG